MTTRRAWSIFVQGVAVEAITWPGKAWADAYRLAQMPTSPLKSRLAAIAGFRAASIGAGILTGCIAGAIQFGAEAICIAAVVAAMALWVFHRRRSIYCAPERWLVLGAFGCTGSCADIAAASLAAWSLAHVSPAEFAPWYALIALAARRPVFPSGLASSTGRSRSC